AARIRREGRKILKGTANGRTAAKPAGGLTPLEKIADFPDEALVRLNVAGIYTLESLQAHAKKQFGGNVFHALKDLPFITAGKALAAHRAILAHTGIATIKGPILDDQRFDEIDREPVQRN